MVVVAQLVRALDCGSRGRRFETGLPPLRGVFKRTPFLNLLFKKMKNFLKTIGIIMIILGTYIFIVQTVNAGGVQIMLGAAIGGMGYIFFRRARSMDD